MSNKNQNNLKAIPIKYYDFQVDFKVDSQDVVDSFLDPNENKHITVLNRPHTAKIKTSTWGTPSIARSKKFEAVQSTSANLVIMGSANPTTADDQDQVKSASNIATSDILYFKSHLPSKKLSKNPKVALSMWRKKTIGTKSEKTILASGNGRQTVGQGGFFVTEEADPLNMTTNDKEDKLKNSVMTGLREGKKFTTKAATTLKESREKNALKSSGVASGLFGKTLYGDLPEKDKRPKSAAVSGSPKKAKPAKEEDDDEGEEEGQDDEEKEDKEEKNDEAEEEEEILAQDGEENQEENNEERGEQEEEEILAQDGEEPQEGDNEEEEEILAQDGDGQQDEEQEEGQEEIIEEGDKEEEEDNEEETKSRKRTASKKNTTNKINEDDEEEFTWNKEEEEIVGTESINPTGSRSKTATVNNASKKLQQGNTQATKAKVPVSKGNNKKAQEAKKPNEDNEDNEVSQVEEVDEGLNSQAGDQEESKNDSVSQASSSRRKYRSNFANILSELQQEVLTSKAGGASESLSIRGEEPDNRNKKEPAKPEKENSGNKKGNTDTTKEKVNLRGNTKQADGFVPYKFVSTIDGDEAQQQRVKVTSDVVSFMKESEARRQKRLEKAFPKKTTKYREQETNEYTGKLGSINSGLKNKVQAMRNSIATQNKFFDEDVEEIESPIEEFDV